MLCLPHLSEKATQGLRPCWNFRDFGWNFSVLLSKAQSPHAPDSPPTRDDQQFDSDPTNQQAALRLNIKWGLAGGGERWGGGGGRGAGQNGGKSEENLELANMDWNEGKGQVKEGPAGAGGRKCTQKAHVCKFLGCREED